MSMQKGSSPIGDLNLCGTIVTTRYSLHGRCLFRGSKRKNQKPLIFYFFPVSCRIMTYSRRCCQTIHSFKRTVSPCPGDNENQMKLICRFYRGIYSSLTSLTLILLFGSLFIFNGCYYYSSIDPLLDSAATASTEKAGTFRQGPPTSCSYTTIANTRGWLV